MESNGAAPPPQSPPAPPTVPPTVPPTGPKAGSTASPPPLPPLPPHTAGIGVDLRVSRRLLWVGEAAYPLHNIVRVQTSVLVPNRAAASMQFLKWTAVLAVVFVVLQTLNEESYSGSSYGSYDDYGDTASTAQTLWTVGIAILIYLVAQLVFKLSRPDQHVLAVETAGASIALVTMTDKDRLRLVVRYIVHAIEHPDAEFSVRVERLVLNPKSYHFGDSANIYGGVGNTGMVKS